MHDWKSCFSTNNLLVDTRVVTFCNVSREKTSHRASDDACDDGMWHAVLPTLMLRGVWASGDTIHS
jgi:hypothetical protein